MSKRRRKRLCKSGLSMLCENDFIIIDIQGFMVNDEEFIPKELASYDNKNRVSHYIFQPIRSVSSLPTKFRNTANWLMNYHHCIDWNDGFVPVSSFDDIVYYLCRSAKVVYVKGHEKACFLKRIVTIPVKELPEHECKLEVGLPMCPFHKKTPSMCSLSNVFYLFSYIFRNLRV